MVVPIYRFNRIRLRESKKQKALSENTDKKERFEHILGREFV